VVLQPVLQLAGWARGGNGSGLMARQPGTLVLTRVLHPRPTTHQGKLEPDARQALISAGQQIKQQLEAVEAKLVQVCAGA
jgi:hypothetical protein